MEKFREITNVYYDFLMDVNDEDEKTVSTIPLLFPEVDTNKIRNELFNLRHFQLHYILSNRIKDQSIKDRIIQEVQSRIIWEAKSKSVVSEYNNYLNFLSLYTEEERLEAIGRLFSERLIGECIDPIVQLGKRASMRNLAFLNSVLDLAIENGIPFVSAFSEETESSNKYTKSSENYNVKKSPESMSVVGFWIGIASIFLSSFILIPLVGMSISLVGLIYFDESENNKVWYGWVGIALNIIFFLAGLYANGNIGSS
jgi:hypothetical protein